MPRNANHTNQVPTATCCGHHPVLDRVGSARHRVTCAFCRRRGPLAPGQNAARQAWNAMVASRSGVTSAMWWKPAHGTASLASAG